MCFFKNIKEWIGKREANRKLTREEKEMEYLEETLIYTNTFR